MSFVKKLFRREVSKTNAGTGFKVFERPTDSHLILGTTDVSKIPLFPFSFRLFYDMYYYCDVLRTILRALIWEIFRNGIEIKEKFGSKCAKCGTEYERIVKICEHCGSDNIRLPNKNELTKINELVKTCNLSAEGLIDVLKDIATDIAVTDNGFIVVVKRYSFDESGKVVGASVIEVLRGSPNKIRLVMSKDGKYGFLDDGRMVFTCLEHRDQAELVRPDDFTGEVRCSVCNKVMYPAWFEVIGGTTQTKRMFYVPGEVLHVKLFSTGIGYGISPLVSILIKVLILIKMDWFILMAYHLQRSPKGLLLIRGQKESIAKAWEWLMEQARINPHMIYPLIVEGADTGRRVAEWIDFTIKAQDIDFIAYRDELRKAIGSVYGVLPIWMGYGTGGLGNEGLQIVVTNRAVEMWQRLFNDKVLKWLVEQLGVTDYEILLKPNEMRDELTRMEIDMKRLQLASQLKALGYEIKVKKVEDKFDFDFSEKDIINKLGEMIDELARAYGRRVDVAELVNEILMKIQHIDVKGEDKKVDDQLITDVGRDSGDEVIGVVGEISSDELARLEGEPNIMRPRRTEQRIEGEPLLPRR